MQHGGHVSRVLGSAAAACLLAASGLGCTILADPSISPAPTVPAVSAVASMTPPLPEPPPTTTPTPQSPSASPAAAPLGDPLVVLETRGGLCPDGRECRNRYVITAAGDLRIDDGPPVRLPPAIMGEIVAALRSTDFAAVLARSFTGVCPTAYDGQEAVFTLATPGGFVTVSSCDVELDPTLPLFVALEAAYQFAR
jgi:hypothetical protein